MKPINRDARAFTVHGESWYAKTSRLKPDVLEEILFGIYLTDEDGTDDGTSGEMAMRWYRVASKPTPRLEAFDDSWDVLASFADVIEKLGEVDSKDITPQEFVNILVECGFQDRTAHVSPHATPDRPERRKQERRRDWPPTVRHGDSNLDR